MWRADELYFVGWITSSKIWSLAEGNFAPRAGDGHTQGVPPKNQLLITLALILCGLIAFGWLVLWARRGLDRLRLARRFRRGARGQARARAFLERRGFEVIAEEQAGTGVVEVDGQPAPYEVRVDYVTRRRGRLYGVEVKTGARATDPLHRPTRRQLLEYSRVFGFDGLFLLDMDARRLMQVAFPQQERTRSSGPTILFMLVLGFLLGAATLAAVVRW